MSTNSSKNWKHIKNVSYTDSKMAMIN